MKEIGQLFLEKSQQPTNWEDVFHPCEVAARKEFRTGQEVHVWQSLTNAPLDLVSSLYRKLSPEEKIKAGRFKFPHDQQRFVISHGILRHILAAYVECDPSDLLFKKTKYGKPFLADQTGKNAIRFNMTHSRDAVCYIISAMTAVGIDIEYVRPNFDWHSISKVYFTPQEVFQLESLPKEGQANAFYILWTRKEALLKAIGKGLSGIDEMGSSLLTTLRSKYTLVSFKCEENYQGTLAVCPETSRIRFFRFKGF